MKPGATVAMVLVASQATTAWAQPRPTTAADVAGAPRPGTESGRLDRVDPGDSGLRKLGRALLWIPRIPLKIVMEPVRGVLYLQSKQVAGELTHGEENPPLVFGVVPQFLWQSGFVPHGSVRAGLSNLYGRAEQVGIRVGYGGHLGGLLNVDADTGHALGRIRLGIDARYDRRNEERFFGYGNGDGISTRYKLRSERVVPYLHADLPAHFAITARGALVHKRFSTDDDQDDDDLAVEEGFDPATVTGYQDGARFVRAELEAAWDTRRVSSPFDPKAIRDSGTLILGYVAHDFDLDGDRNTHRFGFDLQQDFRLTAGPRILELRLTGEAITSELDDVPFTEVPTIGGDVLASADTDRYRDRGAVVARATYLYALGYRVAGLLFGEAGRVYHSLGDLTLRDLHYGVGLGLEGYSVAGLRLHAQVAVSTDDGSVFFSLGFIPPTDWRSRASD